MEEKNNEIIKETVKELLEKIGFAPIVEITETKNKDKENVVCNIEVAEDSHLLIGQYGINLQALQHIARLLVRKKTDDKNRFILDVNSYRQQKNDSVAELARKAADEAIQEGRAVIMRPMSAYERRLVHLELSNNSDVSTESIGEGESRKVVIKPAKQII